MAAVFDIFCRATLKQMNDLIRIDQGVSSSLPEQRGQPGSPPRAPSANVGLTASGGGRAWMSAGRNIRARVTRHVTVEPLGSVAGVGRGVSVPLVSLRDMDHTLKGCVGVHEVNRFDLTTETACGCVSLPSDLLSVCLISHDLSRLHSVGCSGRHPLCWVVAASS